MLGLEEHTGAFQCFILGMIFLAVAGKMSLRCYGYTGVVALVWYGRGSFGLSYEDAVAVAAALVGLVLVPYVFKRLLTLAATYPLALTFHVASKLLPKYSLDEEQWFVADGCTPEVAARRKEALDALSESWKAKYPKCQAFASDLKKMISDLRFTSSRCFPPFNSVINNYLDPSMALARTDGRDVIDLDGNKHMDISGSYGVNVCGYEKYKEFIDAGWREARQRGLFLGSLDNTVLDNIGMLQKVSGHPEVSFHMSGTEAVMAAVRVARFNTKKPLVVTFGGAYHGWWDGMQPVVGNERVPSDVLCLKDMSQISLLVMRARRSEIAAVLVNPLQCFHLNSSPPSDPVLSSNNRKVGTTAGYKQWLHQLRKCCSDNGIVLIFDEVYTGFRLHPRGAQGAYEVDADVVCYGKTLGGGMPVGVVCGPKDLMARVDARKAARVAYVIGTFAGHPLTMSSMNAFLKWLEKPATHRSYDQMHKNIEDFVTKANAAFNEQGFPLQVTNWFSVWSMLYTQPGRYHWMFQYYLKDAGVNMSWVGTGRLLFALDWKKADYDRLLERILVACQQMQKGGWWELPKSNIKLSLAKEFGLAFLRGLFV